MKKLVFIENSWRGAAESDAKLFREIAEDSGCVPKSCLDDMVIVPDFASIPPEEVQRILFDPQNCICTRSSYIGRSRDQFLKFLSLVGRNEIKNLIYIDGSNFLLDFLNKEVPRLDSYALLHVLRAIETNYLLRFSLSERKTYRLRLDFTQKFDSFIRSIEEVNLPILLEE